MERPILFTGEMVRAILAGTKTQTRRIVKPVRGFEHNNICKVGMPHVADPWAVWWHSAETDRVGCLQECPYGKPGDSIWLREAWRTGKLLDKHSGRKIAELHDEAGYGQRFPNGQTSHLKCPIKYEADNAIYEWGDADTSDFGEWGRYRHARFMPRWASRITLEITDVRVERLNDISEDDAQAEGARPWEFNPDQPLTTGERAGDSPYRSGFAYLWDTINEDRAKWKSNPWVWVVSFRSAA